MRAAAIQSSYIPWKGYFDIIHDVDMFIFYDDVQYTKNDWRNRNLIKTPDGTTWLTVPVGTHIHQRVCDVGINDSLWQKKHLKSFYQYYSKARFFDMYEGFLLEAYERRTWTSLSELNRFMTETIASDFLGIKTKFRDSRKFSPEGDRLGRLIDMLVRAGASEYVSGPSASSYIDPAAFVKAGIKLIYKDYSGYPEYPQFHPPFVHGVTILDLLFHTGPDAPGYIWKA